MTVGKIPFNKPLVNGSEIAFIQECLKSGSLSAGGDFAEKCTHFFESSFDFKKCMLTSSCTDALEMAALLLNIQPGDEIITCAYTYVSTANAFVLRGANIIFADSSADNPCIDTAEIEKLISPKTKVIVPVHYAGMACNMDEIMALATKYNLWVVEDAAQCIDAFYKGKNLLKRPLGGIGHLSAFSFHETKNITCGEGGMLVINDENLIARAEILLEKGTNRKMFLRNEVDHYEWTEIGSSFSASNITAAFLYAQLLELKKVQKHRISAWEKYYSMLEPLAQKGAFQLAHIPEYASNNAHIFYLVCDKEKTRNELIKHLREHKIDAAFHYFSLHKSSFYANRNLSIPNLPNSDKYTSCLIRLPLFYGITDAEIETVVSAIYSFFQP